VAVVTGPVWHNVRYWREADICSRAKISNFGLWQPCLFGFVVTGKVQHGGPRKLLLHLILSPGMSEPLSNGSLSQ
jgi:hypothetical protein